MDARTLLASVCQAIVLLQLVSGQLSQDNSPSDQTSTVTGTPSLSQTTRDIIAASDIAVEQTNVPTNVNLTDLQNDSSDTLSALKISNVEKNAITTVIDKLQASPIDNETNPIVIGTEFQNVTTSETNTSIDVSTQQSVINLSTTVALTSAKTNNDSTQLSSTTLAPSVSSSGKKTSFSSTTATSHSPHGGDTDRTTTEKPAVTCMKDRAKNFSACFEALGQNALKYMGTKDLAGFIADICDPDRSRPYIECIKRHFDECPDFLDRIEVQVLQFGPYHIKDIIFFPTINRMCACAPGLICIQKLAEVKEEVSLTIDVPQSPWERLPNYTAICEPDTKLYIGCIRSRLRQCEAPFNRRFEESFTRQDANDLRLMHDFTKRHCDVVRADGFDQDYECVRKHAMSAEMSRCIRKTDLMDPESKLCRMRSCVQDELSSHCDADKVKLFIDAVNIYRTSKPRLLNNPCSDASDLYVPFGAIVLSFLIVLVV